MCGTAEGENVVVNSSPRARNFGPEPDRATTASPPAEVAGAPGAAGSAPDHRYLLDNAQTEAGERFVALAELFDGVTRGHFDRLGVGPGWRCWEVGAGGRSIPEALAAAVGPTGYVLADRKSVVRERGEISGGAGALKKKKEVGEVGRGVRRGRGG